MRALAITAASSTVMNLTGALSRGLGWIDEHRGAVLSGSFVASDAPVCLCGQPIWDRYACGCFDVRCLNVNDHVIEVREHQSVRVQRPTRGGKARQRRPNRQRKQCWRHRAALVHPALRPDVARLVSRIEPPMRGDAGGQRWRDVGQLHRVSREHTAAAGREARSNRLARQGGPLAPVRAVRRGLVPSTGGDRGVAGHVAGRERRRAVARRVPRAVPRGHRQPSTAIVDAHGAHSARYTAVLLSGDAFLKLIENDSAGLRKMVETFERETGGGEHKLCVIVESPDKFCTSKERRGCDYDNPNAGWSRDEYDMCVAQIVVQYADVVLVALPGMAECVEHVVMIHDAIARRRHEPPLSKDFLLDKSHDYMDGTSGKSKKPTSQDFFLRALQRISGVTAPHARGIVREYKSMAALMSAYEDPRTSIADKENMLKDIVGGKNRFGEVKSKRVYDFFKPRHPDDPGDEIISREHARA